MPKLLPYIFAGIATIFGCLDIMRYLAKWEETGRQSFLCVVAPFKDRCDNCLTLGEVGWKNLFIWKN